MALVYLCFDEKIPEKMTNIMAKIKSKIKGKEKETLKEQNEIIKEKGKDNFVDAPYF